MIRNDDPPAAPAALPPGGAAGGPAEPVPRRPLDESAFALARNAHGRLVLTDAAGQQHLGVTPVRAFPICAPDEGVSLVGTDGRERVWIPRLSLLPDAPRLLIEEELALREFVPELKRLRAVSSFSTPSIWEVDTDRGATRFVLKSEEDIRRLSPGRLLIASAGGVQFLVRDTTALDRGSRKLLERFL